MSIGVENKTRVVLLRYTVSFCPPVSLCRHRRILGCLGLSIRVSIALYRSYMTLDWAEEWTVRPVINLPGTNLSIAMRWVSDDVNTLLRFTAVHLEKKGAYAGLNLPYHSISIFLFPSYRGESDGENSIHTCMLRFFRRDSHLEGNELSYYFTKTIHEKIPFDTFLLRPSKVQMKQRAV